jgi:hypothetical protein
MREGMRYFCTRLYLPWYGQPDREGIIIHTMLSCN